MAQLTANNVRVTTASYFGRTGTVSTVERVTFYVGSHGPFTHDFPAGEDNTQAIQRFIATKVQQLQQLDNAYQS